MLTIFFIAAGLVLLALFICKLGLLGLILGCIVLVVLVSGAIVGGIYLLKRLIVGPAEVKVQAKDPHGTPPTPSHGASGGDHHHEKRTARIVLWDFFTGGPLIALLGSNTSFANKPGEAFMERVLAGWGSFWLVFFLSIWLYSFVAVKNEVTAERQIRIEAYRAADPSFGYWTENLYVDGQRVTGSPEAQMITCNSSEVTFKVPLSGHSDKYRVYHVGTESRGEWHEEALDQDSGWFQITSRPTGGVLREIDGIWFDSQTGKTGTFSWVRNG